jgi:hypothetical protein
VQPTWADALDKMDVPRRMGLARIYLLRARLASRLTMGLRVLTLGVVAVAFFFLIEGNVGVGVVVLLLSGVVTWVAGLWIVPWGVGAYSRKLSQIMRDVVTDLRYEGDQPDVHQESLRWCIHRLQRLKPPAAWTADHEKHLEVLVAYCAARHSYQDAIQGADVDAVERANVTLRETHAALNAVSQQLSTKLKSRWTNPTAPSASSTSSR